MYLLWIVIYVRWWNANNKRLHCSSVRLLAKYQSLEIQFPKNIFWYLNWWFVTFSIFLLFSSFSLLVSLLLRFTIYVMFFTFHILDLTRWSTLKISGKTREQKDNRLTDTKMKNTHNGENKAHKTYIISSTLYKTVIHPSIK